MPGPPIHVGQDRPRARRLESRFSGQLVVRVSRRAACFGQREVTFIAVAYEPATTGPLVIVPSPFRSPISFVEGYIGNTANIDGWLEDGAIAPGDKHQVGGTEGCPPSSCDQTWWDVSGRFGAGLATQCSPNDSLGLDKAQAVAFCRNSLFVNRMRVALERHAVQPGETLSGIARDHGVTFDELLAANPQVQDPDLIHIGDVLLIRPTPGICADLPQRPSILAALDTAARVGCFGATTLTFDAQLVVINADIDYVPFETPKLFQPVWLGDGSHPVFVADVGATADEIITTSGMKALELRVSETTSIPKVLTNPIRARVEGHFDDSASTECRPPSPVSDFPRLTNDDAIEQCLASFIVTSISLLD